MTYTRNKKKGKTPQKTPEQNLQNSPTQTPKSSRNASSSPKKDRPSSLKMVSTSISNLEENLKTLLQGETVDKDIVNALNLFSDALKEVSKHLYSEDDKKVELKRDLEDEKDIRKQSHLRGRFMITSPSKGEDLVGNAEKFKDDKTGEQIIQHVKDLARDKYKVEISEAEISTCYALKTGGIVLGLWNQGRGSAFQRIVSQIKSNKDVDKEKNVYFNFMLTKKRNTLLFNVRKMKSTEGVNIKKFFTDEFGSITVVTGDGEKEKITGIYDKENDTMRTLSVEELWAKYQ